MLQHANQYNPLHQSTFSQISESALTREKSLHAIMSFEPGEFLTSFDAKAYLAGPNRYSLQMDEDRHILLAPEYLQYINHSCHPNVFFDFQLMSLLCIRPISAGDEITFFYPSTEWSMSHPFQCRCGSPACLGHIRGAAHITPTILNKYRLSEFIQQMHRRPDGNGPDARRVHAVAYE